MDVDESKWLDKAKENIGKYLDRGGECKGDEPQRLKGTALLNTIGFAMGLEMQDPREWTDSETKRAATDDLLFFKGKARKVIDVIANQIFDVCKDDDVYLTVIPIELYYNKKLYELPLFRVSYSQNSRRYYVDNIGRSYDSYDDWYSNSKLPPCDMVFPYALTLQYKSNSKEPKITWADTPSARPLSKVARATDVVAAVGGITSSVGLIFVTGGLAAPILLGTGIGCAAWGTGRATQQLYDKGSHGESVNPFTNSESRMLWLGMAATIISFGAMGASMRLTYLAARGRDITRTFHVFVNIANGTSLTIGGIQILDNTFYLIEHIDDATPTDILMYAASIAFWTKGAYNYKTAGAIIREAQNMTFNQISSSLNQEDASELNSIRNHFKNDQKLLREYHNAAKKGVSHKIFSEILIDSSSGGKIQFDNNGNLVIQGGHSFSIEFLGKLPSEIRAGYFDIIRNLSPEQSEIFKEMRGYIGDDMNLITGIAKLGIKHNLHAREVTDRLIQMYKMYTRMTLPGGGPDVKISEGTLVLGRAPPIKLADLPKLKPPVVQFYSEQLSRMDNATSKQWASSVPVLVHLESQGLFRICPVTRIVSTGRAVILLNNQLQISIYKLESIPDNDCREILLMISQLSADQCSSTLSPVLLRMCVEKYRLRLECQRRECLKWMRELAGDSGSLCKLLDAELRSNERDRLYQFRDTCKSASSYNKELINFLTEMQPKNISEMVAYGEFLITYVDKVKGIIESKLKDGTLILPPNTKKSTWKTEQAKKMTFDNAANIKQKFNELVDIVRQHNMVGFSEVSSNLGSNELVAAIRTRNIKFASEISAAYHIYKHPVEPLDSYIRRANDTIRSAERYTITLTQDGDARLIRFESADGFCILLERNGRVILCTFTVRKAA